MNKCPYCQNEMKNGFVEGDGRYGLSWAEESISKNVLCRTLSEENSCITLKNPSLFGLSRIKASYCEICKKIIIELK
jgi:hypothetical protein